MWKDFFEFSTFFVLLALAWVQPGQEQLAPQDADAGGDDLNLWLWEEKYDCVKFFVSTVCHLFLVIVGVATSVEVLVIVLRQLVQLHVVHHHLRSSFVTMDPSIAMDITIEKWDILKQQPS